MHADCPDLPACDLASRAVAHSPVAELVGGGRPLTADREEQLLENEPGMATPPGRRHRGEA